jgi:ATP-binding cassette subfamily B protein
MVLDDGKIIAFESHDKLMETCELYQDIYNSQLKREGVFNE